MPPPPDRDEDRYDTRFALDFTELRLLWVLFQCVWPVILIASWGSSFHLMLPALVAPTLLVFWLAAFVVQGNNVRKFKSIDFIPCGIWAAFFLLIFFGESVEGTAMVIVMLFLVIALLYWIVLCSRFGLPRALSFLIIRFAGRLDVCRRTKARLQKRFFGNLFDHDELFRLEEGRSEPQMEPVVLIRGLDHLEDLAKRNLLKRPVWVLQWISVACCWSAAFLWHARGALFLPTGAPHHNQRTYRGSIISNRGNIISKHKQSMLFAAEQCGQGQWSKEICANYHWQDDDAHGPRHQHVTDLHPN